MYGVEYEANIGSNSHAHDTMYDVRFIMSVIILQSTWFPLSTYTPQDGQERVLWLLDVFTSWHAQCLLSYSVYLYRYCIQIIGWIISRS